MIKTNSLELATKKHIFGLIKTIYHNLIDMLCVFIIKLFICSIKSVNNREKKMRETHKQHIGKFNTGNFL